MAEGGEADDWGESDDELLANVDLSEKGIADAQRQTQDRSMKNIVPLLSLLPAEETPLHKLRRGYLWVSDMVSQNWCEHQMIYKMALPSVVPETKVMAAGTNLHLARELEVQDHVQVEVTSDEDIFAIKVVNLYCTVLRLLSGHAVCREVPIFGAPFGHDIFLSGIIDELRCDYKTFELEIVELKTRQFRSLPSVAQKKSHKIQTMIYKKLFDDLVRGRITKEKICQTLHLNINKELGVGILDHVRRVDDKPNKTLDGLLGNVLEKMQSLTCIRSILLEYCYQEDGSTIGYDQVDYDETWFKPIFDSYAMFWKGRRQAAGVDIEEAWKCQKCEFADVCEWRDEKSKTYAEKNNAK